MSSVARIAKPLAGLIALSTLLNGLTWCLAVFFFPQGQSAVLHYSVGIGIDFIGQGQQIIILPVIGLIVLTGNFLLGLSLYKVHAMSAWLFWSIIPVIQLILLTSFLLIWRINS